ADRLPPRPDQPGPVTATARPQRPPATPVVSRTRTNRRTGQRPSPHARIPPRSPGRLTAPGKRSPEFTRWIEANSGGLFEWSKHHESADHTDHARYVSDWQT